MKEYIRMIRQVSFSYAGLVLGIIINPLLIFLLTRNLTVSDYGIYSLFFVTVGALAILLELGLSQFIITKLPGMSRSKKISRFFSLLVFEIIFLTIIAVIFITQPAQNFIASVLKLENYKLEIHVLFLIVFIATLTRLYSAYFVANKKIELNSAIIFMYQFLLVLFIAIFVVVAKLSILWVMLLWLFSYLITSLAYVFFLKGDIFSVLKSRKFEKKILKPALIFSLPIIFIFLGSTIIDISNRYILNYFTDAAVVGIFSLGYSLVNLIFVLGAIVSNVLQPYIAEAWNKKKNYTLIFNIALKYNLITVLPLMACMLSLGYQVVSLVSGPAYAGATSIMPILLPFPLFACLVFLFYQNILLRGRTKIIPVIYITSAITNIVLNFLLIGNFGMHGAAMATTATYFIMFLMMFSYCKRYVHINYGYLAIHKVLSASILAGIVMWFLNPQILITKAIVFLFGILIYIALLFFFRVFNKRETIIMKKITSKGIRGIQGI